MDKQISEDVGKDYVTWNNWKTWKRKVLEEPVLLQIESRMVLQVEVTYGNGKEEIKWILVSRKWLLVRYQVTNEKTTVCLWDLRELSYDFSFYSPVLFFIFLN